MQCITVSKKGALGPVRIAYDLDDDAFDVIIGILEGEIELPSFPEEEKAAEPAAEPVIVP